MKVTFFSNFLNHHQRPFCENLYEKTNGNFRFVATIPIRNERLEMGYRDMNSEHYVICAYVNEEQKAEAMKWCLESDLVICGSNSQEYVDARMKKNLPTFNYSERLFKKGKWRLFDPRVFLALYRSHIRYRNKPLYMLCASAYTSADFNLIGTYKDKCFKWGYFPEVKKYDDIEGLISSKRPSSILWCGRLIDWKHPEAAVLVAEKLKNDGYSFNMSIIGTGDMEEELKKMIKSKGLENYVSLLGPMSPEAVRRYMEEAQIYLFTSDRGEGWGAVLNESMNSGCAVVASHAIGSAPFLIKDGENGLVYRDGNVNDLYQKVKVLLDDSAGRERLGRAAYDTLCCEWNAEKAAEKFIRLARAVCDGEKYPNLFADGVCSKAPLLKDRWNK